MKGNDGKLKETERKSEILGGGGARQTNTSNLFYSFLEKMFRKPKLLLICCFVFRSKHVKLSIGNIKTIDYILFQDFP